MTEKMQPLLSDLLDELQEARETISNLTDDLNSETDRADAAEAELRILKDALSTAMHHVREATRSVNILADEITEVRRTLEGI